MKKIKIASKYAIVIALSTSLFLSCDKDFASIDSDIINNDVATNFETDSEQYDIITYNDALGPVQTNNMPINFLGFYNDPLYGSTTSSFVSQLTPSSFNPDFGENTELESVVLYIPFFSTRTGFDEDNIPTYELDSIFGSGPIKLSIYENTFFLRDFDPDGEFNEQQTYFSNKALSNSESISETDLEGELIFSIDAIPFSGEAIQILDEDDQLEQILPPGIRIQLNRDYWQQKIIDQEGQPVLSNSNNFNEYFRGLYFKAESVGGNVGAMAGLNLASNDAKITLTYTRDPFTPGQDRLETTYELSFRPNRINFFDNNYNIPLQDGDEVNGDSRLYLKGGEGSLAAIKLFNGDDNDDDNDTMNTFETWRSEFVELDENGDFVKAKRLINEANLVFYVDQDIVQGEEPDRIYLYDMDNNIPLIDYITDTPNTTVPLQSISNHLGILQRENDESDGRGIKYKIKITNHINNLLRENTSNVTLGLAVSGNVNLESSLTQRLELTNDDSEKRIPVSSIVSPRGTVLHGNNTEDQTKKVYLEIFYTEPNN